LPPFFDDLLLLAELDALPLAEPDTMRLAEPDTPLLEPDPLPFPLLEPDPLPFPLPELDPLLEPDLLAPDPPEFAEAPVADKFDTPVPCLELLTLTTLCVTAAAET
jgi:hypothetical protein